MKLYSLLNENHVLIDEPASSLSEAIGKLLHAFGDALNPATHEDLLKILLERERQHPTILVDHVCIPHTRMEQLDRFLVGLFVADEPLRHPALNQPVSLVFIILAPQTKNTMLLQTLAAIARLLSIKKNMQAILGVKTANRLIRVIEESGVDIKKNLLAADVMSPVTHSVTMDTVLAKAVDVLVDAPDEGVPVLNEKGALSGELTSRELLVLGMPKYLDLLVNPAMLESFEPFENFFKHENSMTVRELCRRDIVAVEPATPVVQVTHLMMTRHKRRVYVVEEDQLKGVIYRKNIVSRVLHL